ncbi:MAG: hypothetical protein JRE81_14305 [Deltaproteobacteria bacterium]|jgi:hypothetical protein|nr:hypothetical protein [Deltaproteobacteria bacterium]
MPDWLSEHIGEIALLIYIVYPLLKRWRDRGKERRERRRQQEPTQEQVGRPKRHPRERERLARPEAVPQRPTELDFLDAAHRRLGRLMHETSRLLLKSEADPRLARLAPALREDLSDRVATIERSLAGSPTISTIVQETTVIEGLEQLLRYLTAMAEQRTRSETSYLADADAIADACYGPILDLARAQGLGLRTSQPVSVSGDWSLSIVPRFASTRVAPLRISADFDDSLWHWPAIAHEVAHDFYYSLDNFARDLGARLGLPHRVEVPMSEMELDAGWLRRLYGAWLPEVFADVLGALMLGPAYVETMVRAFRRPGSTQRTAAISQDGGLIDEHPPERLRVYVATRVLQHLGRHDAADELWARWETEHPDVRFYYLPLGGEWVGISDENLHAVADSLVDVLLLHPWPELDGFPLLNVPGLAYLHAEHAAVERLQEPLATGEIVDADARWIVAAAVLAAKAQPALHDKILGAARRSIRGVGESSEPAETSFRPRAARGTVGAELVASLRRPDSIEDAIVLGAVLTPYRRPRWR